MKFIVLIYNDPQAIGQMPKAEFSSTLRECFDHADAMQQRGKLLQSQILKDTSTAKTVRIRNGRKTIVDGPFAETKEVLGGFNIIEARDMEEAIELADQFPWASFGSIEIRPIEDMSVMRQSVGASAGV